jgi:Tfp pilus assembly protein PilF
MRDEAKVERLEALIQAKIEIVKNHLDRGQSQAALGGVTNLLDEHSEHSDVLVVAGITHLALGNASYAQSLLHKAFEASPTPDVALNYSSALISRKQYRTARNILRKFLGSKQYKHRERLYHNMGWAYESQRKWKLAEKYYRRALNMQPTFYLSLYRMGVVQEALGKAQKAVVFYRKASRYCGICFDPVQNIFHNIDLPYGKTPQLSAPFPKLLEQPPSDTKKDKK